MSKTKKIYPNAAVKAAQQAKTQWIIKDWTGRLMDFGSFDSFESAEQFLSNKLGNDYETDRQEYDIMEEYT